MITARAKLSSLREGGGDLSQNDSTTNPKRTGFKQNLASHSEKTAPYLRCDAVLYDIKSLRTMKLLLTLINDFICLWFPLQQIV
jgi:hypothetical protein